MRKFFTYSFFISFLGFLFLYFLFPNANDIIDRVVFEKYLMTFSTKMKDFKYNLKLSFNGDVYSYPTYKVTSSKKNYIRLQKQVNSVFEDYLINNNLFEGSDIYYPVKIENNLGDRSKSEIKLFGMNPDHYRDLNSHSFRSKHKGGKSFGKKKENFLKPVTRTYGIDYLWNVLYSDISGGIKIDLKPIRILFNNLDYGFYYVEPFFDKYLIELNNHRDSEIFEIYPDSIRINHIPKEIEFSKFLNISDNRDEELISLIDLEKVYDIISICLMSGNGHSIEDINLHWYYNPIINKIEPTLREVSSTSIKDILGIIESDFNENLLNKAIELIIEDNYIVNKAFNNDRQTFLTEIKNSFKKLAPYFENDEILKKNELKTFLKFNSVNSKFYQYYDKIKANIDLIKPHIKDQVDEKTDTIKFYFNKNQIIKSDILIKNKKVFFEEGIQFSFSNNSMIYFESCEIFIGGENKKTFIRGENKSESGSLFFNNCNVFINNTSFENLQSPINKEYNTSASITFYESNIEIFNSNFSKNLRGDDFINFFRCKNVTVNNSFFQSILSDAIDSDFSNIYIKNNTFSEVGNDAIDYSGSNSIVLNNIFKDIGDKCISIGESSSVEITYNKFYDSETSIVMKDGSTIKSNSNEFVNNKLDYVLFIKKPIYGSPFIEEINESKNTRILIDNKVEIKNDNFKDLKVTTRKNVESILYGRKYGRSSK